MTKKWFWPLGAVIGAAILIIVQLRGGDAPEVSLPHQSKPAVTRKLASETSNDQDFAPKGAAIPASNSPFEPVDPKFQRWLQQEAQSLNAPQIDSAKKRAEIEKVVKGLTPEQSRQLLQTAKSVQAPAGEKILSTFLLVEGGLNTRRELQELIESPVTTSPGEPHSVDEMNNVREKSLKIMAADGLLAKAEKDPRERERLAKSLPSIQDAYVRSYVERRLQEISTR